MPNDRPVIVYLGAEEGREAAQKLLGERAEIVHPKAEAGDVAAALQNADALLDASMKVPLSADMIAAAPRPKILRCATTGADHFERGELARR